MTTLSYNAAHSILASIQTAFLEGHEVKDMASHIYGTVDSSTAGRLVADAKHFVLVLSTPSKLVHKDHKKTIRVLTKSAEEAMPEGMEKFPGDYAVIFQVAARDNKERNKFLSRLGRTDMVASDDAFWPKGGKSMWHAVPFARATSSALHWAVKNGEKKYAGFAFVETSAEDAFERLLTLEADENAAKKEAKAAKAKKAA